MSKPNSDFSTPAATIHATPATRRPAAPEPYDAARAVADVAALGLEPADAAELEDIARAAVDAATPDRLQRVARTLARRARGRDRDMSRARDGAAFCLAVAREGSSVRAARALGLDISKNWYQICASIEISPTLKLIYDFLHDTYLKKLKDKAENLVESAIDGGEITRAQERFGTLALSCLGRADWTPDRHGSSTNTNAPARGAPAQVLINIGSGTAFDSCCNLLQDGNAAVISG